jgi:hypothetical protein
MQISAMHASTVADDESHDDTSELDLSLMDSLVAGKSKTDATIDGIKRDIGHAPLLSAGLVVKHVKDLVPQFGFLGSRSESEPHDAKVFHNINVPFSTFICGVQGSGKSHTTACMLENALIPSRTLGVLQSPISALVFSYGQSQTVRGDFDVSEAVHLAASRPDFPGHCVKKVTVMVSPTNLAMRIRYEKQGHNIRVLPLWVNAKTLDISVLRALMAVDDKAVTLYMAQVESILREIGVTVQAVRESSYCISWCVLFCVAVVIALYRAIRVVCLHDVSMIVIGVEGADQGEEEPSHHHVAPGMSLPHEPSQLERQAGMGLWITRSSRTNYWRRSSTPSKPELSCSGLTY